MIKRVYLVTGSAGFIGSNICQRLIDFGSVVVGLDNLNNYYPAKIKRLRLSVLKQNSNFIFYQASILDKNKVEEIVDKHKPQVLIHAAAEVGVRSGESRSFDYLQTNILGTQIILGAVKKHITHATILSSSSVYGNASKLPFSESEPITTNTPTSIYGCSKAAMEMTSSSFWRQTQIPVTIIRPFSVYGPNGRPDMLPMKMLLSSLLGKPLEIYGPNQTQRDWSYIDDVVGAIIKILEKPINLNIVNIGAGKPIKTSDVIRVAQQIIKKHGYSLETINKPLNTNEMVKTWADTTKLNKIYKAVMKTKFEKGFQKTADYFFAHKDMYL